MEKNNNDSILVVDDDNRNLKIIEFAASEENYNLFLCSDAAAAFAVLKEHWESINVILLDWMMPGMSGIEMLGEIKKNPNWKNIPVIFETAKSRKEDILEGINAGAYYYLTKPFDMKVLLAIIKAAEKEYLRYKSLVKNVSVVPGVQPFFTKGEFSFKTIKEGENIIHWLAYYWYNREESTQGIFELVTNAVEHGNLNISYAEKAELMAEDLYEQEIEKRYEDSKYNYKEVRLEFEIYERSLNIVITDQGNGFDYKNYLDFSPDRAFDLNGRGIAMAKKMYLDEIKYKEPGNSVTGRILLR